MALEGPEGEYIDVSLDVGMGLPDADAWWLAEVGGDGRLHVKPRPGLCEKPAPDDTPSPEEAMLPLPSCLAGDGRLDVELSFHTGGHVYVVMFGNTKREREADLKPLAEILESLRVK